jgi:hypothetical protein
MLDPSAYILYNRSCLQSLDVQKILFTPKTAFGNYVVSKSSGIYEVQNIM